jgi:hypothetical protein
VADGEAPDLEQLQAGRLSFQTGREVVRLG